MNDVTIFKSNDLYRFGHDAPQNRLKKLPPAVYLVDANPEIGFFLKEIPNFELPVKMYGDLEGKAKRILATFHDRPKTTGVLLSGEKGSGKTLLTKLISVEGQNQGLPTIVVNAPFAGDGFNTFIQNINQPCVVLFDEFEKVYDTDAQQGLLTLLDGIFSTKKLFLLTTNNYVGINDHLHNRPGRLYYSLEFSGLDNNFIIEYGKDKLKNQEHLQSLGVLASMVKPVSFDILQAVIEESNRYDESPVKVLEMLNVKQARHYSEDFKPLLLIKSEPVKLYQEEVSTNPFSGFSVGYYKTIVTKSKDKQIYEEVYFDPEHLTSFDGMKGVYHYKNGNATLTLTRKKYDGRSGFQKYEHLAGVDGEGTVIDGDALVADMGVADTDAEPSKKPKSKRKGLLRFTLDRPSGIQKFKRPVVTQSAE